MRRSVARGRLLPQSLSTDPRYGRLSLKAQVLYPLMWINADDQGRLSGDPDEIKYAACPSVKEITADEIPALLKEMETRKMVKVYSTSKTQATQFLDWWDVQKLQWAYPSQYPPPEGWKDRLRYHATPKEIVTSNWLLPSQLGSPLPSESGSPQPSSPPSLPASSLPSTQGEAPLTTPNEKEKEEGGRGRGRGNLPSALGSEPTPSPSTTESEIYSDLLQCFRYDWGQVPAQTVSDLGYDVIPREPEPRELAQLRDLAKEIVSAGGTPPDYIKKAFREADEHDKKHISYIRAVLLDWLGIEREHSDEPREA